MITEPNLAWIALLLLGGIHGLNPAMGWLFAVSLGLQEERRGAVWGALGPLALGHAAAIVAAVALAAAIGRIVPLYVLEWIVAAVLVTVGVSHLIRHRHPRLRGMRVGMRELATWSFLVASAHGAGLMALPFLIGGIGEDVEGVEGIVGVEGIEGVEGVAREAAGLHSAGALTADVQAAGGQAVHGMHGSHGVEGTLASRALTAGSPLEWWTGLLGSAIHTVGYLLVTALVAVVVYEWLGLRLLRTAWLNVNLLWAGALIVTGILTALP